MTADLRSLALGCLLLGWTGPEPPEWLLTALRDGLGGVVLFASNIGDGPDVAALTARLREAAGRDIVIALDEEGGTVTRLDHARGSASPGAAALGHLDEPETTQSVYRTVGARCAAAGVTLNLAPVADVNTDTLNPVIGLRSFSSDPVVAARHVAAAVRGLQGTGVAACLKHFPGHGATRQDSHLEVAVVDGDRDRLDAVELVPFRAGVAAGVRAVMTGHLLVPSLDARHLATVSRPITTDLLRDDLGFTGTVVTDALEMRAVTGTLGMVEAFVRSLAAGADTVETGARDYPDLVEAIPAAVASAVEAGRLTADRVADAARRTQELAAPPASTQPRDRAPDPGRAPGASPAPRADPSADAVAARSLEVLGTLPRLDHPLVVECRSRNGMAAGLLPWGLPLRADTLHVHDAAGFPDDEVRRGRQIVLVVRDPQRHPWQLALLDHAAVVVDCGWPAPIDTPTPVVRTRGVAPALMAAAARLLEGTG